MTILHPQTLWFLLKLYLEPAPSRSLPDSPRLPPHCTPVLFLYTRAKASLKPVNSHASPAQNHQSHLLNSPSGLLFVSCAEHLCLLQGVFHLTH